MLGHVNGCRAAQAHGKLRNKLIKECFDLFPLGEIRVPFLLFFERSLLSQGGESDLATPVFDELPHVRGFTSGVPVVCFKELMIFFFSAAVKSSEYSNSQLESYL